MMNKETLEFADRIYELRAGQNMSKNEELLLKIEILLLKRDNIELKDRNEYLTKIINELVEETKKIMNN